jgi:type I restriction enzyme S subunit
VNIDGSIPDDWKVIRVSDLCRLQRGFDITEATRIAGSVPVYSSSGISYFHARAAVQPPAVVTGRKGLLGRVFYVDEPFWPHDTTLWADDFNGNDPRFVAAVLAAFHLERLDAATSVPTLNRNNLTAYEVMVPLRRVEQAKIAAVMLEADTLIEALEKLIAKKRDVKQGMMQELLTGRRHLPGFTGDWTEAVFGDVVRPAGTRVDPKSVSGRVVELEHMESGTGDLRGDSDVSESESLKTRFESGDVLFGKLRSYLRKFWLADRDGYCSTEIWALRPISNEIIGPYLRYVVEREDFIETASAASGTHMPRADWSVVSKFMVRLPTPREQHAIAEVLQNADSEIKALGRRLESARAVKVGMMQELLTGRTRLPVGKEA